MWYNDGLSPGDVCLDRTTPGMSISVRSERLFQGAEVSMKRKASYLLDSLLLLGLCVLFFWRDLTPIARRPVGVRAG